MSESDLIEILNRYYSSDFKNSLSTHLISAGFSFVAAWAAVFFSSYFIYILTFNPSVVIIGDG